MIDFLDKFAYNVGMVVICGGAFTLTAMIIAYLFYYCSYYCQVIVCQVYNFWYVAKKGK